MNEGHHSSQKAVRDEEIGRSCWCSSEEGGVVEVRVCAGFVDRVVWLASRASEASCGSPAPAEAGVISSLA